MLRNPVKLDGLSENGAFTWFIRVQGPPSSALDRLDQDTTQIPEGYCSIHPTAVGCAGLVSLLQLLRPF